MGAGQSVTALYEMVVNDRRRPQGSQLTPPHWRRIAATIRIRYKRANTLEVEEKEYYFTVNDLQRIYSKTSGNFKLAACVAEFAESLRFPDTPGIANSNAIMRQLNPLLANNYRNDSKVRELYQLVNAVR